MHLWCTYAPILHAMTSSMPAPSLPQHSTASHSPLHTHPSRSAFNVGHMLTNLYGGYMAATSSPKTVLTVGVVVWSLFTMLTPPAAHVRWLPVLLLVRAVMGLGEGVAFPTMQAIMKGWVPADKRTRALSLIYSGEKRRYSCCRLIVKS